MFSEQDFEKLWFLYKTEGEPNGVSINAFCMSNHVLYTVFNNWFWKSQKKVVPVEVEGLPQGVDSGSEEKQPSRVRHHANSSKGSIMMMIKTREGLPMHPEGKLRLQRPEAVGRKVGGLMLKYKRSA